MSSQLSRRLIALSILSSCGLLTACGPKTPPRSVSDLVIREHYNFASPDERLRTCVDRPAKRPIKSDNDVATVITDAFEYGDDCKSKLGATWRSIDDAAARAKKLNADKALPEDPN